MSIPSLPARALALAALALAGCATPSPDGGHDTVARLTRERTGFAPTDQRTPAQADAAKARVAELLARPLGADEAVELALLNHRGLQASLAELGIAEADRVRAGRLANPSFKVGAMRGGGGTEVERALGIDLLGLLTLPLASQVAQQQFEAVQWQAAETAVALAGEVRRAWVEAVAAQQLVGYFGQVREAAEASGELARRMAAAGNFSALAQLREQAFQADAVAQLARARHQALAARERLTRLLGLGGEARRLLLPERLPDLPASPLALNDAEQTAMDRRLDVQAARRRAEATARSLGLTRATRVVNVLHLGLQDQRSPGEARHEGIEVELELPLFDFGSSRVARAEATYRQALHQTAQVAQDARSEVREAHSAYLTAYELARHQRDEVLPLRRRISEETLLRYNGMLVSVFDLLADAREQITGVVAAVEALRDHWVAESALQAALSGRSAALPALSPARAAAPSGAAGH